MTLLSIAIYALLLKALYNFKVKRAHEARYNPFLFQNFLNKISETFEMFKNNMKFTQTAC